jgi:hypothetical protein
MRASVPPGTPWQHLHATATPDRLQELDIYANNSRHHGVFMITATEGHRGPLIVTNDPHTVLYVSVARPPFSVVTPAPVSPAIQVPCVLRLRAGHLEERGTAGRCETKIGPEKEMKGGST